MQHGRQGPVAAVCDGVQRDPVATVAERIRARMGEVSPAERRVARAILAHYPSAGLEPTPRLAERAGVSPATVVRFVARLGFDGYREFQQALRDEIQARRASPLTLPPRVTGGSPAAELRAVSAEVFQRALTETWAALPEADLAAAVELLADPGRRVTSFGGRFSHLLAQYLDLHLRLMRPGTVVHSEPPRRNPAFLVDVGRRDVCVVFDFRRYERETVELAAHVHARGAKVVLVTDPWLSPAAASADLVLPARVEGPSPFDSLVSATAVVEVLVAGVHARLGDDAEARMRLTDQFHGDVTVV